MKALVKRDPKPGLALEEIPIPAISEREVLIKVRKAALCGTDVHIYKWNEWAQQTIPLGLTIGHEFFGDIVAVGSAVDTVSIGDRVSVEGHIFCGNCRNCHEGRRHLCLCIESVGITRAGGFAEYIAVPVESVYVLPDTIPDEIATIADPLGNAVHTALTFELVGEDVLITGAGPIGIMTGLICQQIGARNVVITDISQERLALAKQLGLKHTVNVAKDSIASTTKELQLSEGFYVAFEMSGSLQALHTIIEQVTPGGRVALFGLLPSGGAVDWPTIIFKGLSIRGVYGRQIFRNWDKMVRLLESGLQLAPLITHHFPLERYEEAFAAMMSGESGKVILEIAS